jgi:adenylyltransferase/sulfurtransferase
VSLAGRLLLVNALEMKFREIRLRRDPQCPLCGDHPTILRLVDYEAFCGSPAPAVAASPDEVTTEELARALADPGCGIEVLDVREPEEHEVARIPGARLFPLSALPQRWTELNPAAAYYLHCQGGGRSLRAVQWLKSRGFGRVKSVRGGLQAWLRRPGSGGGH